MRSKLTQAHIPWLFTLGILIAVASIALWNNKAELEEPAYQIPTDWFYLQRAYPQETINYTAYNDALSQAVRLHSLPFSKQEIPWEFIGPTNMGGRLSDVVMHPSDTQIIYAAAASGGVFKSINLGLNWTPIFDDQPSLSTGALAMDPEDPLVLYVGTGESNGGGGSLTYGGTGVYKSSDGGLSWESLGLEQSHHIGRIAIDPSDPQRIFVAAVGRLFSENEERGLYRSTNGGHTWEKVLSASSQTGSVDVAIHPEHPDTVYTALWQRIRYPDRRLFGGEESGVFRSTDGGDTWTELTNGLPQTEIGRIGLSISPSHPHIVYALYADDIGPFKGLYKSIDGGESWVPLPDNDLLAENYNIFGWWFGNLRVHPTNPDRIFVLGLNLISTEDGGDTWNDVSGGMHVDHHGLYIHPQDTTLMISGNDGGLYVSENDGVTWDHKNTLPITQFYTVEVDYQDPLHIAGGSQDNNTYHAFSSVPDSWEPLFPVGDGQYVRINPRDNQIIYASFQRGALFRSIDGGVNFEFIRQGINSEEPFNWSTPIELDPSHPDTLYTGTNRIYRSTDKGTTWQPISPQLPTQSTQISIFDTFGTITSIAVAPSNSNYLYAGTDDGQVWVTTDGGLSWDNISDTLPNRWVTRVMVDPLDESVAYVTFSGFREDVSIPHVFKTIDTGESWSDISANLPEAPVNDIIPDPISPFHLYVATDVGVYYTVDGGAVWLPLGSGVPLVPITDLSLHPPTRKLVAATYGRSMFAFDLNVLPGGPVSIEPQSTEQPQAIDLFENYPNPFSNSTTFRFTLPASSHIQLEIFDLANRKLATLAKSYFIEGTHEIVWDGRDAQGQRVAAGHYFCRMLTDTQASVHQVVIVR